MFRINILTFNLFEASPAFTSPISTDLLLETFSGLYRDLLQTFSRPFRDEAPTQ